MIVVILLCLLIFFWYSEFNTIRAQFGNPHRVHDFTETTRVFEELNTRVETLKMHLQKKYGCKGCGVIEQFNMQDRTQQLFRNYNVHNLYEISPHNVLGSTSFTEGKDKLVMCIRDKSGSVHDINTLTFVMLHELTHVMNDRWGHEVYFWQLFAIVLREAVTCGIYKPVDYAKSPQTYCGIIINQNPLFV